MARPARYNAEYFTHNADFRNDRRIKALRARFGVAGYGLVTMLLEVLTDADYTQLGTDELELELLAGDLGVSATEIDSLLQIAEKIGFFSRNDTGHLICPDLNKALEPVFEKRNRARNTAQQAKPSQPAAENGVSVTETTQSKVNESKVKESKVKKSKKVNKRFKKRIRTFRGIRSKFLKGELLRKCFSKKNKKKPPQGSAQVPPPPPKEPKQPPSVVTLLQHEVKRMIPEYRWSAKEAAAAKQLASTLRARVLAKQPICTDADILETFKKLVIYANSLDNKYYHFTSIPKLNSHYNEILTQKPNGNGSQHSSQNPVPVNPFGQGASVPGAATIRTGSRFGRGSKITAGNS